MTLRRAQSPMLNVRPPQPALPAELMMEILSWVPVKPLLRFRCVCKSWKSLISDPNFAKLHLQRSRRNPSLTLLWEDFSYLEGTQDNDYLGVVPCPIRCLIENPSFTIASNDCYQLKDCYWVVGSCNGLVCLLGNRIGDEFSDFWLRFWNPATMLRSEKLAGFQVERGNRFSSPGFAFGYDNLNDTYKVVAYCLDTEAVEDSQKAQVKVCSLGDNCWRNIESFPVVPIDVHRAGDKDGVFLSSTLNWLAISNFPAVYDWSDITIDQLVIVSFDLGKERCTKLALPLGF